MTDVENYASLTARTIGTISRSPSVVDAQPTHVAILDCVDLVDSRLISDSTGEIFDDLENRVQRFQLHAQVVADAGGKWLVERAEPALEEPC